MSDLIKTNLDSRGVISVSLNRPEVHNAFNDELIVELTALFNDISDRSDIRLVVLSGEGRSFCAGADLNWMKSMADYTEDENVKDSRQLALMFKKINECSKPVIGKINGHALGGGMGMIAVCDYAISHEKAKFGFTETRLGLIPAVISPFCINKIGESNARALFISGEKFGALKAKEINLVHEVCLSENLDSRTDDIINSFLLAAPNAAILAKQLVRDVLDCENDKLENLTCMAIANKRISPEGQDGMAALLEKRKAKWVLDE